MTVEIQPVDPIYLLPLIQLTWKHRDRSRAPSEDHFAEYTLVRDHKIMTTADVIGIRLGLFIRRTWAGGFPLDTTKIICFARPIRWSFEVRQRSSDARACREGLVSIERSLGHAVAIEVLSGVDALKHDLAILALAIS